MIHQASHVKSRILDAITESAFQVAGVVITTTIVEITRMSLNVQTRIIAIAQSPSFLAQMECVFTYPNFVMGYKIVWIPQMRCTVTRRVILTLNFNATAQPIVFLSHGNVMGK